MRRIQRIVTGCLTALAIGALTHGCTVNDDFIEGPDAGIFPCENDLECIEGFVCDEGVCAQQTFGNNDTPPPCTDEDGDGYGANEDRRQCERTARDCDDTDPDRNPGVAEHCDGEDNNCDGGADAQHRIDEFDCETSATACGEPPAELATYLFYECRASTCVLVPYIQDEEGCDTIAAVCDSQAKAFTYDEGDQTYGADEGPILECR